MRLGIPRALLYYHYHPLWLTFWQRLGVEVVTSPPTTKEILNQGVLAAVPEACLPVKVFYGHTLQLVPRVDYLFVPRLVSAEPGTYICPKLMGLPDMLRHAGLKLPPVLGPTLNARLGRRAWENSLLNTARVLGFTVADARAAWRAAAGEQARYLVRLGEGRAPLEEEGVAPEAAAAPVKGTLLVLGHPYNVFDEFVNMGLIARLKRRGYRVLTAEMLPSRLIAAEAARLPKSLFWSLGRLILGAGGHYLRGGGVAGIIHVVSFGCGPDSLVGELLERRAHRRGRLPFLLLTLDEHTGEGGLVTRVEAFLDMIEWRGAS
ncbi:acyl-CoA dehydratase activase-related protein [Gelria sp. Kuro-4]|uniref:acyl-CoA dehydratase activase-related protein n=1 Tax=Gelria sp. Kuro-4 TaxID=2796927 RepID=UPI001BEF2703|nr:acyl-CoA dehydratase activase-related protein [Gelria sp. Kuro-4]BCV25303.1 hypothetical protein kuro4_20760 [Gelria sp. Kuro-4]